MLLAMEGVFASIMVGYSVGLASGHTKSGSRGRYARFLLVYTCGIQ